MEKQSIVRRFFGAKTAAYAVVLLLVFFLGWFLYAQAEGFIRKTSHAWQEINFAYQYPQLVKSLRETHASKSAELEHSLTVSAKEPTAQDKLIEELTAQLKSSK